MKDYFTNNIVVTILILLLTINLTAADYYCNPALGKSTNSGLKESPWGKLEDVFKSGKTFAAGDKIYLLEGNHGSVFVVGDNSKYVKIIGFKGAVVDKLSFGNETAVAKKWTISDVAIVNDEEAIYISANSSKIKLNNISISSSKTFIKLSKDEILSNKSIGVNILGSNCKVENISIFNKNIGIFNTGNGNQFKNNVITNFSGIAISTVGDGNSFDHNLIQESFQVSDKNNIAILISSDNKDVKIKNNIFRANQIINFKQYNRENIGQLDGVISDIDVENTIIENNVVITNSVSAMVLPLIHNSKIVNNTIANPYFGIVLVDKKNIYATISIGSTEREESVNVIIRNNIADDISFANVKGIEDHNVKLGSSVVEYDKNFFSWAKFDFSLTASSAGLNKGTLEGAPKYDINSVPRSIGNFINVGAFEYGKIDESNEELIVIVDPRDRELRSKGKDDWDGQPQIRVGGSGQDFDGVAVFPFQLPLLPGGKKIVEADFSAYMIKIDNRPEGNLDVYGLPFKVKDKFWVIPHEMFYQGDYGQDLTARPIQRGIADGSSITGTTKLNSAGKLGLKGYLNTSYSAGATTNDFVFIRLNPSSKDVTPFHRWIFQGGNSEKDKHKAKLYLTIGYPELNKEGVVVKEIKNTLVLSSNILKEGKIDLRFYGFKEGESVKVKLLSYKGEVIFEKEITSDKVKGVYVEAINEKPIAVGKYFIEYTVEGKSKKQTALVW